jgi:hypothetical protein
MGKESDSQTRVILAIAEALFPPLPQAAEEARKNGAIQETIRFLEFSGNQYRTLPKEVMSVFLLLWMFHADGVPHGPRVTNHRRL